ncbi:hypothetical protein STA3757_43580 [Stanieria sp. NIES-3757]|nr:hypothetical protein STA3757_43580 [Stanieria sp. NIES-3757]
MTNILKNNGIKIGTTAIIWCVATGMMAICIPLVVRTQSGIVLPLTVILGTIVSTALIWLSDTATNIQLANNFQQIERKIQELEQKITAQNTNLSINSIPHLKNKSLKDLQAAIENKEKKFYLAMFAEDIKFFSPVKVEPVQGKEIVGKFLELILELVQDFQYIQQLEKENLSILIFQAKINNIPVEGINLICFNCEGLVNEFKIIIRPLDALQALAEQIEMPSKLIMN